MRRKKIDWIFPLSVNHILFNWSDIVKEKFPTSTVYLVGSALIKSEPRDIDIVAVLSDIDFFERFNISSDEFIIQGKTGLWTSDRWSWSGEMGPLIRQSWKLCKLNIDFQVIPQSLHDEYNSNPTFQLSK